MILKEGDIGLSGGNSLVQRCIKFFTNSQFSHSFTVIKSCGTFNAFETTSTIVSLTPVDRKLYEENYVEIWRMVDNIDIQSVLHEMFIFHSGHWYGYLSYVWFIYRWICKKFGYKTNKMWSWCINGITCTELTINPISIIYPELFTEYDVNTITPQDLRDIMVNNPDKFLFVGWYVKR